MLYLCSSVNLIKNIIVKLWSYTIVRVLVAAWLAYYIGGGFYSRVMARASNVNFAFPGWDTLFYIPNFAFNPSFIKSGKASFGIMNSITRLGSIFAPGLMIVGIILYLQKVFNTYKAPPLPVIYRGEDAEDVIVADYRMPVLYTKGEAVYYDEDEDEYEEEETVSDYDLENGGVMA